ncbi:MAG: hypothetical protein IPL01_22660, partial [Acidobacteria bacterium]|nr:hypothetical protein [Acidobacteriota bacterium]
FKASRDGVSTNQADILQGPFPSRQSSLSFKFRSERAGKLRLIIEGTGMIRICCGQRARTKPHRDKSQPSAVRVRSEATVELTLLDYQWRPAQAPKDIKFIITATTYERLIEAQGLVAKPVSNLDNSLLLLPQSRHKFGFPEFSREDAVS